MYFVIYDGNCNLCVTLVQLLETLDGGNRFRYIPMQQEAILAEYGITAPDCEQGMILIDSDQPERRWQGSDAVEEIGNMLPLGDVFVNAYRSLPGMKSAGDQFYQFIRDNRYTIFGKRDFTYLPKYPYCKGETCNY